MMNNTISAINYDFITLHKLGVGCILVRYSDIILIEPTHQEYSRLDFSFGDHIIVEEGPFKILQLIKNAEYMKALEEAQIVDQVSNASDKTNERKNK
jgi:hypothetical protein